METTKIIADTIIKLLEQGGPMALWGLVLYMLLSIMKILAIGGAICLVIRSVASGASSLLNSYNNKRLERVSLLSRRLSSRLEEGFTTAFSDLSSAVTTLGKECSRLREEREERSKSGDSETSDENSKESSEGEGS